MSSPQYKSVKENKGNIERALKLQGTTKKLITKLQEKDWVDIDENPSEDQIMTKVLGRLQDDNTASDQYEIFMKMLKEIVGLDQIIKQLDQAGRSI